MTQQNCKFWNIGLWFLIFLWFGFLLKQRNSKIIWKHFSPPLFIFIHLFKEYFTSFQRLWNFSQNWLLITLFLIGSFFFSFFIATISLYLNPRISFLSPTRVRFFMFPFEVTMCMLFHVFFFAYFFKTMTLMMDYKRRRYGNTITLRTTT